MVYFVESADYRVFMDVQQEIYLRIVAMLAEQGVRLALPAQTIHVEAAPAALPAALPQAERIAA